MPRPPFVLLAIVLAPPLGAQALPQRVAAIRDGTAMFTYPVRSGVCGDGRVIIVDDPASRDGQLIYSGTEMHVGDWSPMHAGRPCDGGPARVRLTVRDSRVTALRPTVGGGEVMTADHDLGQLSGADAAAYLLDVAASPDEELVRHAMLAAMIADSARIAPRLTTMSRDRSLHPSVRQAALRWLARTATRDGYAAEAARAMQAIAGDSTDAIAVRDRAIRGLGPTEGGDVFLRGLYFRLTEPALRDRVLRVVGEQPTAATLTWIENIALNGNETVALRDRALRVVAEQHSDPARVRALYPRLNHDALKERAVRLAGAAGDAASERWLLALTQDEKEPLAVRERALKLLAQNSLSTADLAVLYDSLHNRTLRSRLIQQLAERGGDAAVDKLVRIAGEDPDSELRRQAARRLAQSGDPRAQAYFERTLKN